MKTLKELMNDMHFNLILYVLIGVFGFLQTQFGSNEAAKYINPDILFWLKTIIGTGSAACLSAKLFLSTSYADWQAKRNGNGNDNGHSTNITNKEQNEKTVS